MVAYVPTTKPIGNKPSLDAERLTGKVFGIALIQVTIGGSDGNLFNTMEPLELVDIGVNLMHRSFANDRVAVIERAFAAGVRTMIVTATDLNDVLPALFIAQEFPDKIFTTAGVHPHYSQRCNDETIQNLRKWAQTKNVVAIGECGLDFNRDFSPRPIQEKWFTAQIALAEELQIPLFLHERDTEQRFLEILAAHRKDVPGILHCFSGDGDALTAYLDLGLFIGITGWICDPRRGIHLREIIRQIPFDRLMIETDAPFLSPRPKPPGVKDHRNEPSFLPDVLKTVSECLGKSPAEVAERTTKTAKEFFGIPGL